MSQVCSCGIISREKFSPIFIFQISRRFGVSDLEFLLLMTQPAIGMFEDTFVYGFKTFTFASRKREPSKRFSVVEFLEVLVG